MTRVNESVAFAPLCLRTFNRLAKKGELASSYGSEGLFLCYVITMLVLTIAYGWPALVILILVAIGYAALLGELNDRHSPSDKSRRRSHRKR
jgi:hypothetical protein